MSDAFEPVFYHRFKYFLSPQLDLYRNIRKKILPELGRSEIVDYGCGWGFGTIQLTAETNEVHGIDVDEEAIKFAKGVLPDICTFSVGDWTQDELGPRKGSCDLITCIEVLEHCARPEHLVEEISRSLSDRGLAVFSTLNHNSQYRKNDAHVGKYNVASFRELLESTFHSVRMTDYGLTDDLYTSSTRTPVVGICRKRST